MKNRVGEPTKLDFKTSQKPRKCGIGQTCKSRNRMGCVCVGGEFTHTYMDKFIKRHFEKDKTIGPGNRSGTRRKRSLTAERQKRTILW